MASISGKIIGPSGAPIQGLEVNVGNKSARTNAQGVYTISGISTGSRRFQISMIINEGTNTLSVTMVAIPPPTGTLTGKVTDSATGAAISGVTVSLAGTNTTTDSSGNYGFTGITPGTYVITFTKAGYNTVTR
jgi:protocatechuate 3,4-dioxygenase beta subunit